MREFRQDPNGLKRGAEAAWVLALAGLIVALSAPHLAVLGLFTMALGVVSAVVLHDLAESAPPYLVLERDGLRLAFLNAHIPWSDIDRAALVPRPRANIRNHLAIDMNEAALAEALRRAPQLKAMVRRSVLRRRRLEIALPALDAPYAEVQASLQQAWYR